MRVKHWCTGEVTDLPIREVVVKCINTASGNGHHVGQLEDLENRLSDLTKAFGVLVEHIGEAVAKKILDDMSCPTYKVTKDPVADKKSGVRYLGDPGGDKEYEPFVPLND